MTTDITPQALPRRSESGMNTRAINTAAGVLLAAMQQGRQTPTGLAIALDSARLLNSPETAAEDEQLRARLAEFCTCINAPEVDAGLTLHASYCVATTDRLTPQPSPLAPQERSRTMLDRARDALNARMTKDNLRLVLENVVTYAAELEARLAEYERPVDEDPIAYTLTEQADGITRRLAPVQALREEPADSRREARLEQLLDTIRTHGGKWSTGSVQALRRTTGGPVQRGTARRDLAELAQRGHLTQHGAGDGRFYTLRTRKDRA